MAASITSIDTKKVRRGRYYAQIWIHGTDLPPVPAPGSYLRITSVKRGTYVDYDNYLVYGPELAYVWGSVPKHTPRGMYDLTFSDGGALSTITNAIRVT